MRAFKRVQVREFEIRFEGGSKMAGELVSKSELGRRLGVSEAAIRKHCKRGLFRPNKDGLLDADVCRQLWEANRDPDSVLKGMAGAAAVAERQAEKAAERPSGTSALFERPTLPETSLSKARTAHAALSAQRTKLALDRERGELIKTADAYAACRAVVTLVCERLDGVPGQIAQRVVGLDAVAAERVAREAVNSVRAEIAKLSNAIIEVVENETGRA